MAPGHGQYEVGFNDQAARDEVALIRPRSRTRRRGSCRPSSKSCAPRPQWRDEMVVFLGQVGIEREPRANVRMTPTSVLISGAAAGSPRATSTAASSVPAESFLDRQRAHSTRIEPGRTAWRDVLEKACFPMQRLPTWDRCNEPTHENRDFQHQ